MVKKSGAALRTALSLAAILPLCMATVYLEYLYINSCGEGFLFGRRYLIIGVTAGLLAAVSFFAVKFGLKNDAFIYRISLSATALCVIFLAVLYFGQKINLWQKIRDVNSLRAEIEKRGAYAVPAFIILQILQVTALPIPGVVAIGAGVCLFGEFKGGLYSFIGITAGSFISFFVGRTLGYKAAKLLIGKKTLDSTLKKVKGKDKAVLTVMFLLPFFPDDALCFVAGLSSMSAGCFSVTIIITRLVSSFVTAYSVGGKIIPYDKWWGIILWGVIILSAAAGAKLVYDKGEIIQKNTRKQICRLKRKFLNKKPARKTIAHKN
ncbi:MAG: VTT domain-containing protein [Candidatus Borkfalkiaceae bacterium]|nr:VTT domain-containing protein [Christensenellaceae bacterium]